VVRYNGLLMTKSATTPEPFKVWTDSLGGRRYLHGTKADLKSGDLIEAGRVSKSTCCA